MRDPAKRVLTFREPYGVMAVITPWNFPTVIPSEYLGPGLAVGNCVVMKPASTTPLSMILMARCIQEALDEFGLPPGVFNLVTGPGRSGGRLSGGPSRRGSDRLHRRDGDRRGHLLARRHQADTHGAGRQRSADRLRRRQPGGGGEGGGYRLLLQRRPGVLRHRAHPGGQEGARRVRRAAAEGGEGLGARRSDGSCDHDGPAQQRADGRQDRAAPGRRPGQGGADPAGRRRASQAGRPTCISRPRSSTG